ncbi:hypothetical protein GGE09_003585 [Roseobacter sp. N2S]|nr:hypothetical protein [Roseobacter sp. N2S]
MSNPTCSTCPYFGKNRCHRQPPRFVVKTTLPDDGFPHALPNSWCGEHPQFQARLNKGLPPLKRVGDYSQ